MYINNPALHLIFRRVRVTIVPVEKQEVLRISSVYSLSNPALYAHAPYYIVICDLSGFTIHFHITS